MESRFLTGRSARFGMTTVLHARPILDIFGQTLWTLWGHKLRSFLTMFGIAD
jgi:hypothetical protein